jgi:DNA gyrase subunit B
VQTAGADLMAMVREAVQARHLMEPLLHKVALTEVLEQTLIAGALNPDIMGDPEKATAAADYIARRLDSLVPELERGWQGEILPDGGLVFQRSLRGVTERQVIDGPLLRSTEARRLDDMTEALQAVYHHHGQLKSKEVERRITGPSDLVNAIFELGRKGVGVQRYKGLGEMNPEQLWETTLDPESRALLQVRIAHTDEASDIFSTLMGDVVGPRRDFIQSRALEVTNLDI